MRDLAKLKLHLKNPTPGMARRSDAAWYTDASYLPCLPQLSLHFLEDKKQLTSGLNFDHTDLPPFLVFIGHWNLQHAAAAAVYVGNHNMR